MSFKPDIRAEVSILSALVKSHWAHVHGWNKRFYQYICNEAPYLYSSNVLRNALQIDLPDSKV